MKTQHARNHLDRHLLDEALFVAESERSHPSELAAASWSYDPPSRPDPVLPPPSLDHLQVNPDDCYQRFLESAGAGLEQRECGTVHDASGQYELTNLAPGVYEIKSPDTIVPVSPERESPARSDSWDGYEFIEVSLPVLDDPSLGSNDSLASPPLSDSAPIGVGDPHELHPSIDPISYPGSEEDPSAFELALPDESDTVVAEATSVDLCPPDEVEPTDPPRNLVLESCAGMSLSPGETVVLTRDSLRIGGECAFTIEIMLLSPPREGVITLNGFALTGGDIFTQEDIDHGRLQFRHEGSASGEDDGFLFATPNGEIHPHTFPLRILPVRAPELINCGQLTTLVDGCRIADLLEGTVVTHQDHPPGIAVVGVHGRGKWEYSLDGTSTWEPLNGVNPERALLLAGTNAIRFVPQQGWSGLARLSYRAWDRRSGVAGDLVDISDRLCIGGHSAYSREVTTASVTIAPGTVAAPLPTSEPWKEPVSVYDLVGNSLAIVRLDGPGTWQYSLDEGKTWLDAGTVYHGRAVLLRETDRLRFLPRKGAIGKVVLGGRSWTGVGGGAGGRVNLAAKRTHGNGTPYSDQVQTRTWYLQQPA